MERVSGGHQGRAQQGRGGRAVVNHAKKNSTPCVWVACLLSATSIRGNAHDHSVVRT